MVPTDLSDRGPDEVIYEEVENVRRATRPRALTVLATVFAGVLIVMIGGLASYYYYTVQSQSSTGEQNIRTQWNDVVAATVKLTDAFAEVKKLEDLTLEGKDSFETALSATNRSLRDVLYGLQGSSGYSLSGNIFNSRLTSFLDDYIAYLRELQRVIDKVRGSLIKEIKDIDALKSLGDKMNESYDNLLVADKGKVIEATIPRELFAMTGDVEDFAETYVDEQGKKTEADDADKSAANEVVTKFLQAYKDKDTQAMTLYLTQQAESEFKPGAVQEETSEIKSYKLTDTRKLTDTKIEINAELSKETPDGVAVTDKRLFVMLKQSDGKWLVDSWKAV